MMVPDGGGPELSSTILSSVVGLVSGAISAVATMFYWGGGTRSDIKSLQESQRQMQSDIRLVLKVLMTTAAHRNEEN